MTALANACTAINNASRAKKGELVIFFSSKEVKDFLNLMLKYGYLNKVVHVQSSTKEKVVVELNGRLNKCGAICPRFNYKCKQIPAVVSKLKPARQFGHVVFKTCKGVIDHDEATEKRTGGKILGFFY